MQERAQQSVSSERRGQAHRVSARISAQR
jgi:hypothetical protein